MTTLNLVSSKAVSSNIKTGYLSFSTFMNGDFDDAVMPEPVVPTFEYAAGIDPKAVMVIAISVFAILSVVFALGFRGVL